MITLTPADITLILYTPLSLVIVATAVLLLVYENEPEVFEVGGVSTLVIVCVMLYIKPGCKINGPNDEYNDVTTNLAVVDKGPKIPEASCVTVI